LGLDFNSYDDQRVLIQFSNIVDIEAVCDFEGNFDSSCGFANEAEYAHEKITGFIDLLNSKIDGHLEQNILLANTSDIFKYKDGLQTFLQQTNLTTHTFVVLTKDIPLEVLDQTFLGMSDYCFTAHIILNANHIITQSYCEGEYDTGWFSHDQQDCYINTWCRDHYPAPIESAQTMLNTVSEDSKYSDHSLEFETLKSNNLNSTVRKFRISAGFYGGELTIGIINQSFADYMANSEYSLEEIIRSFENGQKLPNVPLIRDEFCHWDECDDVIHIHAPYADSSFTVTEIDAAENDLLTQEKYAKCVKTYYLDGSNLDHIKNTPVLVCHTAEKGTIVSWYLELHDEDFDASLINYSQIQTNMGNFIDKVWYGSTELEENRNDTWTVSNSFNATIAYINLEAYQKSRNSGE
tara:strand:+ start:1704 stop:2927 length:1224 start_codon:yes stop_codon:yes gene_type:complete